MQHMTVKDLKKFLEDIPENTTIDVKYFMDNQSLFQRLQKRDLSYNEYHERLEIHADYN